MDWDGFGAAFKMVWDHPLPFFLVFPQSLLIFLVSNHHWDVPEILLGRQSPHEDHCGNVAQFLKQAGASEFTNKFTSLRKFPHWP